MARADELNAWVDELARALHDLFPACPVGNLSSQGPINKRVTTPAITRTSNASGDKLAYLAYTGKVELFVRDELAWALQKGYQAAGSRGSIGREHEQVDLVAFDQTDKPVKLLQAKAMYVGDLLVLGSYRKSPERLLSALFDDIRAKVNNKTNLPKGLPTVGLLLVADIPVCNQAPARLAYPEVVFKQSSPKVQGNGVDMTHTGLWTVLNSLVPKPFKLAKQSGAWCGSHNGDQVLVHWFLVLP